MIPQHTVRAIGAIVALLAVGVSTVSAQMFVPTGRDTLRALPGVEVVVDDVPPELVRRGLSSAAIRATVTARLHASGVSVYGSQTENPSPAKAYLYVHLNGLELPAQDAVAIALQVQLRQTVRSVVRETQIVNAMTWDAHNVVVVPLTRLDALQAELHSHVDLFIRDWVSVH
jgi:hypothetical protein